VRWDGGTLRVICLVATAVSAGYLWRAALEGDPEFDRLLDTSPPASVRPNAAPQGSVGPIRTVTSPDRALGAERRSTKRADPVRSKPAAGRQKRAKSVVVVHRPGRRKTTPSRAATPTRGEVSPGSPKKQPKRPKASPGAAGKTSTPKGPRDPRGKPPTGKSGPTGGSTPPTDRTPTPVTTDPTPVTTDPTPVTTDPSAGKPPEPTTPPAQTPTGKPVKTPTRKPEKTPTTEPEGTPTPTAQRPGWGHGDENHDHAGPPGQAKKGGPRK